MKTQMDEVNTAGSSAALCERDERCSDTQKQGYGTGGVLEGKKYKLSLTFNTPIEAFYDPSEFFFQGKFVDDLWFPMHMNFRFFAMSGQPAFACYDVMKNPTIAAGLESVRQHVDRFL